MAVPIAPVPRNPKVVEAPAARLPFHARLATVTVLPDPVSVPFHACSTLTPLGIVIATCQPESAAVPGLATVTSPWKPPPHELTSLNVAAQALGPSPDDDFDGDTDDEDDRDGDTEERDGETDDREGDTEDRDGDTDDWDGEEVGPPCRSATMMPRPLVPR